MPKRLKNNQNELIIDTKSRLFALEEMIMREKIVGSQHNHKIWQDESGMYHTYVDDETKPRNKRLVSSQDKGRLIGKLYTHYRSGNEQKAVEDIFNLWSENRVKTGQIEEATHARYARVFQRYFGDIAERDISLISLNEMVDLMEYEANVMKLTSKGISDMKSIAKHIFNKAKRIGATEFSGIDVINEFNSIAEVKPRVRVVNEKKEVFNEEETIKVVQYLSNSDKETDICLLLIFVTGLRVGEAVGLNHSDFDGNKLSVQRTESYVYIKGKETKRFIKDTPKTKAGIRTVYVPSNYKWLLNKIRRLNPFETFCFSNGNGKRMTTEAVRDRLKVVCEDVGIEPRSPHKIRKTYCSILLDNNLDKNFVIHQVGHIDISVTENSYHRDRKTEETKQQIIDSIPDFPMMAK